MCEIPSVQRRPRRHALFLMAWVLASGTGALAQQVVQHVSQRHQFFPVLRGDVYVVNTGSDNVSVIDSRTNTVTATIAVADTPYDVAFAPDGTRAYVTSSTPGVLSVIDTNARAVIDTIAIADGAYRMKLSPDGTRAVVTHFLPPSVSMIDVAARRVLATIPMAASPSDLAFTPDGTRIYVTVGEFAGAVLVIDALTNTVTGTIPVAARPFGIAMAPDGSVAYVTGDISNMITVIDTATNTVQSAIILGPSATSMPFGIAVRPDGNELYVTVPNQIVNLGTVTGVFAGATVMVVDPTSQSVTTSLFAQTRPYRAALPANGRHVYVTNHDSDSVSVIDTATHTVMATIAVGDRPRGIAVLR